MKVPNVDRVIIPREKVVDYLLSETHPDGRPKAAFFARFGYVREFWETLTETLRQHVTDHDVARTEDSPFGTRYVVEGIITAPDGRTPRLRSVWFIRTGENTPWFVTAYPLPERLDDDS